MNADNLLIRCHALGDIMPADNARVAFTATCIDYLIEIFNAEFYNRPADETTNKYCEKGIRQEELAITLLALNDGRVYHKNEERFKNEFITGVPDIIYSKEQKETLDTKCAWSKNTFDSMRMKSVNASNKYQGHGYMALTGAVKHTVAYCLVNGTANQIEKEKQSLDFKGLSEDTYNERCKQIEINHIFDLKQFVKDNPYFIFDNDVNEWHYDVPASERIHKFIVERDEAMIEKINNRVKECRQWMNENLFKIRTKQAA